MSLAVLLALVILPAAAWAERAIDAEVDAEAPFEAAALTQALRARLPEGDDAIQLRVAATFDGVRIEARGAAREVPLRGLAGEAAARLVALAAADLLVDTVDVEPPPLPRTRATTIGVLGGAAAWTHPLGVLGLDLALPRRGYLFAIEAGAGALVDGPVRLTAGLVRAGLGVRRGVFELRVAALAAPVVVTSGAGDATLLAGASASARIRFALADDLRVVVAVGADAFATRTTYVVDQMTALVTPRLAPWAAIGLELAP